MWAITTRCNCRCYFCKVWRKQAIEPSLEQALQTVDILHSLGCYSLSITGGEPLLYPHIAEVVDYAHDRGFIVQINTNGSLLAEKLGDISRADLVTISLDYPDERYDKAREYPQLLRKALEGARACKRANMRVDFSTLLLGDQEINGLLKLANGFKSSLVLSYPEVGGSLHADAWNVPSKQWLIECFKSALAFKEKGAPIFNTKLGLRDAIRYLETGKRAIPCFAGESIVYIDWSGWVYPCLHLSKICRIDYLAERYPSFPKLYSCNECYDQAWLDLSAIEWTLTYFRPDLSFQDLMQISRIALKMA